MATTTPKAAADFVAGLGTAATVFVSDAQNATAVNITAANAEITIYGMWVDASLAGSATDVYVKIFEAATPPASSDALMKETIVGGTTKRFIYPDGIKVATGSLIAKVVASDTAADESTSNPNTGSGDTTVKVVIAYT